MKLVFVADLHLHAYKTDSQRDGSDRLADGLSAMRQTLEFARQHGATWVFGGDLKLPRRSWPHDALTGALAVLREYDDVPKVLVKGNHDGEGEYGSGLQPFADLDATIVVDVPRVVDNPGGSWVGRFAAWPAVSDPKWKLDEFVASVPPEVDVLVGHGFIAGAKLGPDEFRAPGGITLEALGQAGPDAPRFKVVLFGDVHKGQVLARGRGRGRAPDWVPFAATAHVAKDGVQPVRYAALWRGEVYYVGSPYQQNWGEREDGPKGTLFIDTDSGEVQLLHVEAPRYVLEDWTDLKWRDKLFAKVEGRGEESWRGNFVRVLAGEWAADQVVDAVFATLWAKSEPRSFRVDVVAPPRAEQRTEVHGGMGRREMLEAYVAARPLAGAEPEPLVRAGLTLMGEDNG